MSQTVGSLLIRIGADIKGLQKGLAKAERKMMRFGNKMQNIGQNLSATVSLPIAAMGAAAVKSAVEFEQLETRLNVLMGSAKKGADEFERIKKFAATTPFDLRDVTEGDAMLRAFGLTTDEVWTSMQTLGDAAAATGGDFKGLALILGQAKAEGAAYTKDLRQLASRGIPILGELKDMFGVNGQELKKMVEGGQISFEVLELAMKRMTSKGGIFFNAMEAQSKTVGGAFSNLKDVANIALAEIGSGIIEAFNVRENMVKLVDYIDNLRQRFTALTDKQKKFIVIAAATAAAIGPLLIGISGVTKMAVAAVSGFKGLLSAVTILSSPIGLIVAGLAALAAGIYIAYQRSAEFRVVIDNVTQSLIRSGKIIVDSLSTVWAALSKAIRNVYEENKGAFQKLGQLAIKFVTILAKSLAAYVEFAANVVAFFAEKITWVEDKFREIEASKVGSKILAAGSSIAGGLGKVFDSLVGSLESADRVLFGVTKGFTGDLRKGAIKASEGVDKVTESVDESTESMADLDQQLKDLMATMGLAGDKDVVGKGIDIERSTRTGKRGSSGEVEENPLSTFGGGVEVFQRMRDQVKAIAEQMGKDLRDPAQTWVEGWINALETFQGKFNEVMGVIGGISEIWTNARMGEVDRRYEHERAQIESSRNSEDAKQKAIQKLDEKTDKKRRKIARAAAIREKILGIISATINTAVGITKAIAQGFVWRAVMIGAMGAIQIGKIASQNVPALAGGGLAYAPTMAMVGDNKNARVDPEVIAPLSKLQGMIGGVQHVVVTGKIDGRDILLAQERASQDRLRTRGF